MCGIAGWIGGGPSPAGRLAAVERMVKAMRHRGPDAARAELLEGTSPPGNVGLGHTRLAILDRSPRAGQPMHDPRTGHAIVLNGEIYNYRELARYLSRQGWQARTRSDTEVVLGAYAHWGRACLERFRGMFAFALWDARRQELWCVRDRLGIKPFYYATGPEGFLFASELRALVSSGRVSGEWDDAARRAFLRFGSIQEPLTVCRQVKMLAPGHWLRVGLDGQVVEERCYWSLEEVFAGRSDPTGDEDEREVLGRLRETLAEAVRYRLVSDVPVGVFLSGGIDSSAVVALAARAASRPLKTFTVAFPGQEEEAWNEAPYARQVAQRYATDHREVHLTEDQVLSWIPEALAAMDQPSADGLNTWVVSRAARQAGLSVALSGLGGDELFAGYPSFQVVPRIARLCRLGRYLPRFLRCATAWAWTRLAGGSIRARKLTEAWRRGVGWVGAYHLYRQLFPSDWQDRLLGTQHDSAREDADARLVPLPEDPIRAVSLLELSHYTRNTLLRDTDVMSMAHGLEVRVPLLDHKLVELVAQIPGRLNGFSRWTPKALLVEALADALPQTVTSRPKWGFILPFDRWLRGPLRERVGDVLLNAGSVAAAGLEPRAVQEVWHLFQQGAPSVSWSRVWALVAWIDWTAQRARATDDTAEARAARLRKAG